MKNETQYTSGPWRDHGTVTGSTNGQSAVFSQWGEICRVADCGGDYTQRNANANLIAAAPELLAALINLRGEVLRRRGDSLRHPHADKLLEQAAQAVAKALGQI